ncbi:hypothetical protein JCM24511_00691 [Saitozyma sp. JCM 24511]|nr:hypothetical protein JCM24511_00691 [Saitozyma sp. JCM 24511]
MEKVGQDHACTVEAVPGRLQSWAAGKRDGEKATIGDPSGTPSEPHCLVTILNPARSGEMVADKYQEQWLEREFVGYGFNQPDPKWPGGAKIAVSFVVQFNMGAVSLMRRIEGARTDKAPTQESSVEEGDPLSESYLLEIPKNLPVPTRNENTEMMYEYGGREGVARVLSVFKKHNMPLTWNVCMFDEAMVSDTRALEKAPYWIKPIVDSGAEISLAGDRYLDHFSTKPEVEDKMINTAIDKLQALTGDKTLPEAWMVERRSNMSVKLYSLAHKERSLPLLYSSDSNADDLPYWDPSPTGKGGLLMLPFSYDCTDARFNMRGSGWASPKDYFLHLKDTFDCLYMEGEKGEGKMMTVLLHPHIIGRAGRIAWFEKFLEYIESKEGVWVARRKDIAAHWTETFPYDSKTAFGQTKVAECGQI